MYNFYMNPLPLIPEALGPNAQESTLRSAPSATEPPRLRRPDRRQMRFEPGCVDERLPSDHPARSIWAVTGKLDLAAFYADLRARGCEPGRAATDPRLLIALWLLAYTHHVGNGRELARLCEVHDAYRWMCGGVTVNYHTLNDFRVAHEKALDDLFTQVLAVLLHHDVVKLERLAQDGTKVRASAGSGSFRRRPTLEQRQVQARAHVEALKQQAQENPALSAQRQAARQRAAREKLERVEAALAELSKVEAGKAAQHANKPSAQRPPRASMTDPEARTMRLANNGFGPAYNVQIASDPHSRAIVAIDVINHGTDHGEDQPLRAQVERRTGRKMKEQLLDGGYVKLDAIVEAAAEGVAIYAPLPKTGQDGGVCTQQPNDPPAVAAWRARMTRPESQSIYKQRGSTAETVNADLKTFRGLRPFGVRGLPKCRCVALLAALAYNLMHFAEVLLKT
jgi:transposase